jgi:F-type H+-transporting ATPase subunit b
VLINWFTVFAQLINFIILVFLLRKFLYQPILNTIETRQKRIKSQWQEAHFQHQQAEQERVDLQKQQQQIQQESVALMVEAKQKAQQYQQTLIQQAKAEVAQMQADWKASLQSKQNLFLNRLRQQVIQQTAAMTRKILQEITDTKLESQAVIQFLHHLQQINQSEQQQLIHSLNTANEPLLVRSSFAISPESKTQIVEALQHQLNLEKSLYWRRDNPENEEISHENQTEVQFTLSPDLICGIELRVGGYELSWNFAHELKQLNQQLSQVIQNEVEKSH